MTEETLFIEALEIADPAGREAFLDRVCAGNPDLRGRLGRLFAEHARAGPFLDRPATLPATALPDANGEPGEGSRPNGGVIGPYELVEVIGEGGMGTVWRARQTEPVTRQVALKVIKAGMDSKAVLARFEAERQALALMDHPNIATVLDAGATPDGRPYFVMELVKGTPITKFCDERRLAPKDRLELFIPVCEAVQHAHLKGVIHRDIKPSNVLVALYDGRPVPKVIDFGVVKAAGKPLTERTFETGFGAVVGTPEYMSPEQAELNQLDIDTRSDVYSLGVLLYELLTGTTPLQRKRVKEAALWEVLRLVREEEPPKPSSRLSTTDELPSIAANRGVEPRRLSGLVKGELDWIVMKALEKDRDRRYETPNGFAADLRRHLTGEPVSAVPPSALYRLRKFTRRNRTALATAGAFATLLVAATIGSVVLASWAMRKRDEAEKHKQTAEADFKRALGAVDKMLTQVGEVQLASVPQMEPVRKSLLRDALGFYREFLLDRGEDPRVRTEVARAHRRVGQIQYQLGQYTEAETDYRHAADVLNALLIETPDDPTILFEQALVHRGRGTVFHMTRRWPEAEGSLETVVTLLGKVERTAPAFPSIRLEIAKAHADLLNHYRQVGKLDKAEAAYEDGRTCLDRLPDYERQSVDARLYRGSLGQNVGLVYTAQGRVPDAEAAYHRALDLYRELHREFPDVNEYRRRVASTINNLGLLYAKDDRNEKAEEAFKESLAIKEEIHRDFPNIQAFKLELAGAYDNLAMQVRMRSPEEALVLSDRSIRILDSVLEKDDRDVTARMTLFNGLMGRAYALGRLNRHKEAATVWRRVLAVSERQSHINMRLFRPFAHLRLGDHAAATAECESAFADGHTQPPNLHRFAGIFSLASALAAKDETLDADGRAKLAARYGDRAVEFLKQARTAGHYANPTRVTDLKEHNDFEAIRKRPDVRAFLAELETK